MLVRRPASPASFNGSVIVEWFNVTAEMDIAVLWGMTHTQLVKEGYAYVGISAQKVGVDASPLALKIWDPLRYSPLNHPGDAFSYDIFSQVARALVSPDGPAPLGELRPQGIIGAGESQAAMRINNYVRDVDAEHRMYDGFLIHSWTGEISNPRVPTLVFLTETEKEGITSPSGLVAYAPLVSWIPELIPLLGILGLDRPIQALPDSTNYRVWDVAGSAHYDQQALDYMSSAVAGDVISPFPSPAIELKLPCLLNPINRLAQERAVRGALQALNSWLVSGEAPNPAPRVELDERGHVVRDEDGLARGGIRLPPVAVPIGVNEGKTCIFFGSYNQFSNTQIRERYPTAEDYQTRVRAAAAEAVRQGWLLQEGADAYAEEAAAIDVW